MWLYLGTVAPNLEWQDFAQEIDNCELLRFSFSSSIGNFNRVASYIWVRRRWPLTVPKEVSPSFRVYPKFESVIVENTIPESYKTVGLTNTGFECKRGYRYLRQMLVEPAWSVTLEGWQ